MANINAPDLDYFESFAKELEGKFQRISKLVKNNAATGNYHEEIFRAILRNFLSKRFSVKQGFIYKNSENVSNQLDIIIVDENSPAAYLFQEDDFAIVLPQAVVAVLEIKTTLNAPEFDLGIKNIASAKSLYDRPNSLTGILFGYSSKTKLNDENLNNWFLREAAKGLKDNRQLGPDSFMFFEEGLLLMGYDKNGNVSFGGGYYHKVFLHDDYKHGISDAAWQLSVILATIINSCEIAEMKRSGKFPENIAGKLIQSEGNMMSSERFSLGEGKSELPSGNSS